VLRRGIGQRAEGVGVADVGGRRNHVGQAQVVAAARRQAQLDALLCQGPGDGGTDATAGAGDEGNPAVERFHGSHLRNA